MAAHSPASSPRLPSPPPMAEDQLGPASPGVALFEEHGKFPGSGAMDMGASRRIRPGTRAEDMAEGPPLVELGEIDSAFQLTEHLKALHYHHTHPPNSSTTSPITPDIAKLLATPPPGTSREIWLYELARFLIQKTNAIIVALFADSPPCSPQTCSEMRASEWQYLCAVHDPPKSCAAIDYCCHTLDWAATTLTSSKMFPSRLGLGSGAMGAGSGGGAGTGGAGGHADKVLQQQMKEITNIFRRVYRIYAHAWFQHREMFWRVEGRTGLYGLFKTVCDEYGLIQAENYTISPEAEGLEPPVEQQKEEGQKIQVLARPTQDQEAATPVQGSQQLPVGNSVLAAGDTTKRHRHTASDLSMASSVTTVIPEEAEEEEQAEEDDVGEEERQPDLQRQATELRHFAESLPQPGQGREEREEDQEEQTEAEVLGEEQEVGDGEVEGEGEGEGESEAHGEPEVGVRRSDTVKPRKENEEVEMEKQGEEAEADQTVVEVTPVEADEESENVEPMEPSEAPAAEAEEAGKTVAD